MASYEALVKKITTAEINRVQREGGYDRWAYFVDPAASKVGIVVANNTAFAAYAVTDEPDPKLSEFGMEPINSLELQPDPELLILGAGDNLLQAVLFTSPAVLVEDDFVAGFDPSLAREWQAFLRSRGVRVAGGPKRSVLQYVVMGAIVVLVIFFAVIALTN